MLVLGITGLVASRSRHPAPVMDAALVMVSLGAGITAANRVLRARADLDGRVPATTS